ncbi:L-serine ammonia-lyase, iron-sulfur-dependent subunit beta [Paenibacillus physcomitrellae]|uniref:L-serine deaminase n=1 Tax=Paenibacillus physcomitrellae TaxID=1619311 RepID=A0ABQ1G859_9BACL|nr:L-serine ammonia-lyase, iron-sulfur-dependent subunit beta [Paenibacillus physcomitrellae]GGA38591.1 putative L-serine dehydratase, beta chain [Paenibacillus physcomitrellae]
MRFKDVFSIIGPVMVGPSSSHTAGAARIGRSARHLYGKQPEKAVIIFYGSFAATYQGHGTDRAIVGGLLDYDTDDSRIPMALDYAKQSGLEVSFEEGRGIVRHPNTAKLILSDRDGGSELTMTGISIGGGNIEIIEINGFNIKMTGIYPTLVIQHYDSPGVLAYVTQALSLEGTNIAHMSVDRKNRSGNAITVVEIDGEIKEGILERIAQMDALISVGIIDLSQETQTEEQK